MSTGVVHKQLLITSNLSVNSVHSVNKVVNPHKDNYHYVGGGPPTNIIIIIIIIPSIILVEQPSAS
jgi:hypothetical protein